MPANTSTTHHPKNHHQIAINVIRRTAVKIANGMPRCPKSDGITHDEYDAVTVAHIVKAISLVTTGKTNKSTQQIVNEVLHEIRGEMVALAMEQ